MAEQDENYKNITSRDFPAQVLQAEQMVVVNFSSGKSGACQIFDPEFMAASKEYKGRVTFARLNLDDEKDETLVNEWRIDGIPTVIFYKQGQEVNRIKGIVMREKLRKQIEGVLLAHF
ncbi:MAG TPA: thioredoxin family protein [Ktedonobacteraceae bacterium]|nr:thioredoxin family protein [Ktedonobacteraceae bacterium]